MKLVSRLRDSGPCVVAKCAVPAWMVYEDKGFRIRACGQEHAKVVANRIDSLKKWCIDNECTPADVEGGALLFCTDRPEWRHVVHKVVVAFLKEA